MKTCFFLIPLFLVLVLFQKVEFDFGTTKDGTNWQILNDGVMGGLSKGEILFTENSLKFSGAVSLENYGGFTSVKSPFQEFTLANKSRVKIRYKTSGQSIAISLENSRAFYKPYFKLELEDTEDSWKTKEIAIEQFKQYNLGQVTQEQISGEFLK
ncbi:MAG: CIA30 family protein, partial [Bacteroidota bacterium]